MISSGTKFFLFWILLGLCFFIFSELVRKEVFGLLPSWVNYFLLIIALIAILIYLCLVGIIISRFGEKAGNHPEYLIVLGAQVNKDSLSTSLKYRLDAAREYLKEHPETKAVLCGGQGKNEPETEAEAMRKYLSDIDENRLILEKESTTTRENLRNSLLLTGNVPVCVVTNNFHLYRAQLIAHNVGYTDVSGIAANSTPYYLLNNITREVLAIGKEWAVNILKRYK